MCVGLLGPRGPKSRIIPLAFFFGLALGSPRKMRSFRRGMVAMGQRPSCVLGGDVRGNRNEGTRSRFFAFPDLLKAFILSASWHPCVTHPNPPSRAGVRLITNWEARLCLAVVLHER